MNEANFGSLIFLKLLYVIGGKYFKLNCNIGKKCKKAFLRVKRIGEVADWEKKNQIKNW